MKKQLLGLLFLLTVSLTSGFAQGILNHGFESLNADSSLSNWGNVYLNAIWVDSNGVWHSDSIVVDGGWYYGPSTDAHSGNLALELRNSWNFSTNEGIAGAAGCDDDSVFSAWGLLNLIPTYATVNAPFHPSEFGFYYKYSPVHGDTAYANLALWDSIGNAVGNCQVLLTEATSGYTYTSAPINYSIPGLASFYSLSFGAFYTDTPGLRQPGFGTRLLVDDVGFQFAVAADAGAVTSLQVYPNPGSGLVHVRSESAELVGYRIHDGLGRRCAAGGLRGNAAVVSLEGLGAGVYMLEVETERGLEARRLVVGR